MHNLYKDSIEKSFDVGTTPGIYVLKSVRNALSSLHESAQGFLLLQRRFDPLKYLVPLFCNVPEVFQYVCNIARLTEGCFQKIWDVLN